MRKLKPKILFVGVGFLILAAAIFLWSLNSRSSVFEFVFSSQNNLDSTESHINILLLGIAGGTHDGALLTDSIILASYQLKTNKVLLISIPRDLWIKDINGKVNTLYELGLKNGNGLKYAEDKIGAILGIRIHYGVRLDFKGFASTIDSLDGIEVFVPKTFDDDMFPIEGKENDLCDNKEVEQNLNPDQASKLGVEPGKRKVFIDSTNNIATDAANLNLDCRYNHIHFDGGPTKMNGETALNFVRSRHGTNGEGSDFARSKRQQLILTAFRNKALSLDTLTKPTKISSLISNLGNSIETDVPPDKLLDFYRLAKKVQKVDSVVLEDIGNDKSLFINPFPSDYGGAWVLIPPDNNFDPVKELVKQKLHEQDLINDSQK